MSWSSNRAISLGLVLNGSLTVHAALLLSLNVYGPLSSYGATALEPGHDASILSYSEYFLLVAFTAPFLGLLPLAASSSGLIRLRWLLVLFALFELSLVVDCWYLFFKLRGYGTPPDDLAMVPAFEIITGRMSTFEAVVYGPLLGRIEAGDSIVVLVLHAALCAGILTLLLFGIATIVRNIRDRRPPSES